MLEKPRIRFKLNDSFIEEFVGKQPEWGPLGYITYKRTYSRQITSIPERCIELANKHGLLKTEEYWLTCVRVIEGVYNIQKAHCEALKLPWNNTKAQTSAQEMFRRLWAFKWSPPGRGLWMMGTDILWDIGSAPLYNCSFCSTTDLKTSFSEPFCYLMDMSMLGVGVGFDTRGAGTVQIRSPKFSTQTHIVEDSREGWIESTRCMLDAFVGKRVMPSAFDYTLIRSKGEPIKRFGGVAPGPEPLRSLHVSLAKLFYNGNISLTSCDKDNGEPATLVFEDPIEFEPYSITSTQIVDTFNLIGKCVVSGGVRRSAEMSIGDPKDKEFINLKQDKEKLEEYRFISNNSIFAEVGMNYEEFAELAADNGEPGFLYLDNARKYGRMIDPPNSKDNRVAGWNPCIYEEAPILTREGIRKTKDINVGDIIWTGKVWSPVINKCYSGLQQVNEYRTATGSFFGTANHNVLSMGTKVPVSKTEFIDQARGLTDSIQLTLDKQDIIDGILLGIGLSDSDHVLMPRLHKRSEELYHLIMSEFLSNERSNILNTYVIKSSLTLDELKLQTLRSVPVRLFYGTFSNIAALLQGLFSSRGKVSKVNGTVSVTLYSQEMAQQVQILLSSLGIASILKQQKFYDKYQYRIVSSDIERFAEMVGFLQPSLQTKLTKLIKTKEELGIQTLVVDSVSSFAITDIISVGESLPVYDITVDDPSHTLWCGALHIANCTPGDTLVATADGRGAVTIRELAEQGSDVPVYTVNPEGLVEIKWGRAPRLTRKDSELVKIILDDNTEFICTPDHGMRLLNGIKVEAQNLKPGDSLPRFDRYKAAITKGKEYLRVNCNTLDSNKNKIYEHRIIAKFNDPNKWNSIYDEQKKSGWIKGGVVVHHKDYDKLNNNPDNLEIMTFKDHQALHASLGLAGEKNPMYGKHHLEEAKQLISLRAKALRASPEWKHPPLTERGRLVLSESAKNTRKRVLKEYYINEELKTDLKTVWVDEKLCAIKCCEICQKELITPWRKRHLSFCSISCMNKSLVHIQARQIGIDNFWSNKMQDTLHKQIMIYKDLEIELNRLPSHKEWKDKCKQNKISYRFRGKQATSEFHIKDMKDLRDRAKQYNHRVKSVEKLSYTEDVYNITTDDNHTVAYLTSFDKETGKSSGIFTFQCGEIALEPGEFCNVPDSYPSRHDSYEDYELTLKYAYLFGKSVTLLPSHNERTNAIQMRNRRIGLSQSGIIQNINKIGLRKHLQWCDKGYNYLNKLDEAYSEWLCIPKSIKKTSIKPSGSISLMPGVTPGIHFPEAEYYIRNIRIADTSPIVQSCIDAGYIVEDDTYVPATKVVSFPVHEKHFVKSKKDVTIWEQMELGAQMQAYWADNGVSQTVSVQEHEKKDIANILEYYETRIKGISFLPLSEHGYVQAPYIPITKELYEEMIANLKPLDLSDTSHEKTEIFCSNDVCEIDFSKKK